MWHKLEVEWCNALYILYFYHEEWQLLENIFCTGQISDFTNIKVTENKLFPDNWSFGGS